MTNTHRHLVCILRRAKKGTQTATHEDLRRSGPPRPRPRQAPGPCHPGALTQQVATPRHRTD
ncbi:hypothetical protein E2C01_005244 [Portunus trituberculatus]|uniref:Uncharacterized protein n=1 Tax=Portunus trituberculatus TaxID=210409 RepID=A0A5B7CW53_PORTR|nr:hypothetical protein [Portunus trituberculatus]